MITFSIYTHYLDFLSINLAFGLKHVLFIVAAIFFVLIVLALLKSSKLSKESERLSESSKKDLEKKEYQDFTEGHLYQNNEK